ncbi:MAG TPA: TerC family protein [Xanthobacteraceae bacterium]|nr:TerC family protein [Xanthobacteraceae bacterium]
MDWILQIFDPSTLGAIVTDFEKEAHDPAFWIAVGQIIWIDILLSGDNALVIALACRGLQERQRFWGMILGAGAAVLMRVIFTGIVATLMVLPYLKLIGGLALLVIAAKLLVPDDEDEGEGIKAAASLIGAIQIIVVADVVMSLDNVIAIAAAAKGNAALLIFGLAVSIPLIIAGAAIIMALLTRFPALVWAGAALLGWIAGNVIATDRGLHSTLTQILAGAVSLKIDMAFRGQAGSHFEFKSELAEIACGLIGIVIVLVLGSIWRRRKLERLAVGERKDLPSSAE